MGIDLSLGVNANAIGHGFYSTKSLKYVNR